MAKNLARSAAIIFQAPHLEQFAISYTIGDQKDSRPFMVWADRRLGASELAFAATATRWTLHNATTGFLLPFTHQCVSDHQDNPYLTIA